jgi:hypothetical protein
MADTEVNAADGREVLEGCMCEYIPEYLREQIENIADKTGAYPSQVVTFALQIGLAVLIGKTEGSLSASSKARHGGKIRQTRRGKLSGNGA